MEWPDLGKNHSISEQVYNEIYNRIVTGNLRAEDRIIERELATSMGISRAPVREAFRRLCEDRLVILVPRGGCFVAKLSKKEIREIYEIRKHLECMALRHAMERLNKKRLATIKYELEKLKKVKNTNSIKKAVKLDTEFHQMVSESSDCINLQDMLRKLRARMEMLRVTEARSLKKTEEGVAEHINIVDAILRDDLDTATGLLAEHIEHTMQDVLQSYE